VNAIHPLAVTSEMRIEEGGTPYNASSINFQIRLHRLARSTEVLLLQCVSRGLLSGKPRAEISEKENTDDARLLAQRVSQGDCDALKTLIGRAMNFPVCLTALHCFGLPCFIARRLYREIPLRHSAKNRRCEFPLD
jgi:hypothetical protein